MYKISANIVCKNERYWIKESILSIVHLVDEVIFIDDNSIDGSLEIVKELSIKYPKIKIHESSSHKQKKLCDLKNYAMLMSKNEMILRWDADFIAYNYIYEILKFSLKNNYDAYVFKAPNLHGDIFHYLKNKEYFGPEVCLYKKSKMRFEQTERYNDYPVFDKDTKYCYPQNTILNKDYFFIHMNKLKSIEKLAYRKRMTEYQMTSKNNETYWEWLGKKHNISHDQIKKSELKKVKETYYNLCKFDFNKWGKHPDILLNSDSINLFKVIVENGKYKIKAPN